MPSLIVVEIGAAVLVVEAVFVFGLGRAQIGAVGDAVAVAVDAAAADVALAALGGRPGDAAEDAEVVMAHGGGDDAGAGAEADGDVAGGEELEAAEHVGRVVLAGVERVEAEVTSGTLPKTSAATPTQCTKR